MLALSLLVGFLLIARALTDGLAVAVLLARVRRADSGDLIGLLIIEISCLFEGAGVGRGLSPSQPSRLALSQRRNARCRSVPS